VGRVQQSTAAAEILLQHEQAHKTKNEKQWVRDHQTKMKGKSKNKYNMSIITYEKGQI